MISRNQYLNNHTYLEEDGKDFLKAIDELIIKTHYTRLTVLDYNYETIGEIQGTITGGSISVNGTSAIRRSGNISLIAITPDLDPLAANQNYRITELENIIYLNKKVFIEVGYENTLKTQFPQYAEHDIIYFPLGLFIMANANISKSTSGININLTLKDQMALLNGEHGGTFETAITHSPIYRQEVEEDEIVTDTVKFNILIKELIEEWTHLSKDFIHVEDIPDQIANIMRWTGEEPIYLNPSETIQGITNYSLSTSGDEVNAYDFNSNIGYRYVDFIYPTEKELTSNAGDNVTSVLDKIKAALGNYEYFFDVFGEFYFRKIQNYVGQGVGFNDLDKALGAKIYNYLTDKRDSTYTFVDGRLITSYQNNPVWQNVKNDFVVWGENEENKNAIRYHLIIDNKPVITKSEYIVYYYNDQFDIKRAVLSSAVAQRRIDYVNKVREDDKDYTPQKLGTAIRVNLNNNTDWRLLAYYQSLENDMKYFYSKELVEELPKIIDISKTTLTWNKGININTIPYYIDIVTTDMTINDIKNLNINANLTTEQAEVILAEYNRLINKFKVSNIGKRTKVINDNKINCLFDPVIPDVYFLKGQSAEDTANERNDMVKLGIKNFYQVPPATFAQMAVGTARNSAYELLRAQIHTLLGFNETVTIGVLPIYYLEPNTRIEIEDDDTSIHGGYMINSFTLPLDVSGNMSISCTKAIERV